MHLELLHAIELTKAPLEGWSSCVIGLCFNVIVTVVGGLILDYFPNLLPASDKVIYPQHPVKISLSRAEVHSKCQYSSILYIGSCQQPPPGPPQGFRGKA